MKKGTKGRGKERNEGMKARKKRRQSEGDVEGVKEVAETGRREEDEGKS